MAASAALILTPGPAVLYIIARSVGQGRKAGLVSVVGVGLGNLIHAIASALGLAAVLTSSPLAYGIMRYLGAAYLIYLGVRKLLAEPPHSVTAIFSNEPSSATFRQAVVVAVLNPKTALFFVAFLPQFVDPVRGPVGLQLLALGVTFVVMAVASDALYALLAGTLGSAMRTRRGLLRTGRWISGLVYCGLGIIAAVSR